MGSGAISWPTRLRSLPQSHYFREKTHILWESSKAVVVIQFGPGEDEPLPAPKTGGFYNCK